MFSGFLRFVSISEPVWIGGIDSSKIVGGLFLFGGL